MPEETIIQNMIAALGQSQGDRHPRELDADYASVDERTPPALRAYAQSLAAAIPFVQADGTVDPDGWKTFFSRVADTGDGSAALTLFNAFLELYEYPRASINQFTGRHLDFFYRRVLGFVPHAATPDRAHVVLSLKKGSAATAVQPVHMFSGGKDASGAELLYAPTADTIVNTSKIESIRSVFLDPRSPMRVRFAPVANSADGLGTALPEDNPKWHPFGHPNLPVAPVGFGIASPILRLKEGHRTVTLSLTVNGADRLTTAKVTTAFDAFLTGEKQWLGPYPAVATLSAGVIRFVITMPDGEPAVVDYNPKVHAYSYSTGGGPVLQLLLKTDDAVDYADLSRVTVDSARISVDVEGVTGLTLESDAGSLDPKKAFLPFGPQPSAGSRFVIGCDEALSKSLSRLDLTIQWKGAPFDFATQYAGYTTTFTVSNSAFTASAVFHDRESEHRKNGEALFGAIGTQPATLHLMGAAAQATAPGYDGDYVFALSRGNTTWSWRTANRMALLRPIMLSFLSQAPEPRRGSIVLTLDRGFLHSEFREQAVAKIAAVAAGGTGITLLKEPYTPTVQSLTLGYTAATADVRVSSVSAADFASLDVQFFLVGPFGQMRDHGHQRASLGFVGDTHVPLVPTFDGNGELLFGLSGLSAGDSVTVLFQTAEGSADPDRPAESPAWFVLCDNYWKSLGAAGVVRDTTNRLLASGVITFVIPKEATTANTILPTGLLWLKGTVGNSPENACQLVDVLANAVEVQYVMDSEDAAAAHLATALPKNSIAKLTTPIAPVSKVTQPYPSFGGRPREGGREMQTRVAERLRHKNRGVSPWDYERLVLDTFPSVHRAKCIPHASADSWLAPGHVLVVVVPDLRNRNTPDPLQPRVDADTIARIGDHLAAHVSGHVALKVKNPNYQKIRISCAVKFRTGYEFNFYRRELERRLIERLSPWAFDTTVELAFGGRIYASVVLNFIEELPFVDYVTDFKLTTFIGGERRVVLQAEPERPDCILVSDSTHDILEAP